MMTASERYEIASELLSSLSDALDSAGSNDDLVDVEGAIACLMFNVKQYMDGVLPDVREEEARQARAEERDFQRMVL